MIGDLLDKKWDENIQNTQEYPDIDRIKKSALEDALDALESDDHKLRADTKYTLKEILKILSARFFKEFGDFKGMDKKPTNTSQLLNAMKVVEDHFRRETERRNDSGFYTPILKGHQTIKTSRSDARTLTNRCPDGVLQRNSAVPPTRQQSM